MEQKETKININWYPGHMAKTKKQMLEDLKLIDVVVEIVDARIPKASQNPDLQEWIKHKKKIMVFNKADLAEEKKNQEWVEYYKKQGQAVVLTDSNTGKGIQEAIREIEKIGKEMKEAEAQKGRKGRAIRVMVVGIPNVGKSSLLNQILGENRAIVSNVAGTTRDAIDSYFENETGKYNFIDTAGIRRKSKVKENIEKYSVMRSNLAIDRADVCIMMIDANEGVSEQDSKIIGEAHEAGKGIIIAVNKWDEVEKDNNTTEKFKKEIYNELPFATYAPIIFISAKTGQRVNKLFEMINSVASQNALRVSTAVLNQVINEAIAVVQPPTDKGKRLKIFYGTQASTKPPTFVIFVNRKELFHFSYERYLVNCIRNNFGLEGTPVRIIVREKKDEKED